MNSELAQKAVASALVGNWGEAIKINKKLLEDDPDDPEVLNRLAKALFESGEIQKAKRICQKVIKIDHLNSIAIKNITKWKGLENTKKTFSRGSQSTSFIEEPGKTKMVSLLYPGDIRVIAKLNAGDEVFLSPHCHRVSVTNAERKYLGRLPDDLAARLRQFIKHGNCYQVFVKSIDGKNTKVFIREVVRAKSLANYVSFTPPAVVRNEE